MLVTTSLLTQTVDSETVTPNAINSRAIAHVGTREITLADVKKVLHGANFFEMQSLTTSGLPWLKRYIEDVLIREELLVQAAQSRGALERRAVRTQLNKALANALVRHVFAKLGSPKDISNDEVHAYYHEHQAEYHTPERVRVWHIRVATKAEASALLTRVKSDATREHWSKLAHEKSLDTATQKTNGDLGLITLDGRTSEPKTLVPLVIAKAAFAIKDGEFAPEPIETEGGWHVIWRRGSLAATERTVTQEAPTIRTILFEKKRKKHYEEWIAQIQAKAQLKPEIDDALLALIEVNVGARPIPKAK